MKSLVLILMMIINFSIFSQTHNGCELSNIRVVSFDSTKTLLYTLVIRYEGKVVSINQLDYLSYTSVYVKIDSKKIKQAHLIDLISKYSAQLDNETLTLNAISVGYDIASLESLTSIGDKTKKDIGYSILRENLPSYLTATLEVITLE